MNRIITLLLVAFIGLTACKGCGDEQPENNVTPDNNATMVPVPGEGQILAVDLGELDFWSAAQDGVLPRLEEPLSADETTDLVEGFSWAETEALAETDADGRPALYYALFYLDSRPRVELLDDSGIYHDMLPLFGEERERWAGQVGAFGFRGNDEGVFAFAIVHGQTYNTIRELALEGDEPFRAVILRDPPDDAVGSDGSLSYDYLAARGFTYGTPLDAPETTPPNAILPVSWIRAQANLILDTADELRRAATDVAGFFGGRSDFIINVMVLNSDPTFASGTPEPPMLSAWRRGPGNEPRRMNLQGASLRLQTELLLANGTINSSGTARIHAFDDAEYTVCIAARNNAVEVSEFLTPVMACHFAAGDGTQQVRAAGDGTPLFQQVVVKDYVLNIMTQMTDAQQWMTELVGFTPRQARVLVGPLADFIGLFNGNRAFAACNGADDLNVMHGFLDGLQFTPLEPLRWILANDVLFPGVGDGATNDTAAISRGVPTHEYGHFVLCQLLHHMDYNVFGTVWADISLTTIAEGQPPGASQLWINEGFADWFSFQVTGGTNYFSFAGADGFEATDVYYCDPTRASGRATCMEDNVGGPGATTTIGGFDGNVALTATLMQDLFDGPPTYDGPTAPQGIAGDGVWSRSGGTVDYAWQGGSGGDNDEPVALPPRALYQIVQKFVWQPNAIIRSGGWFDAMARVARDYGYTSEEICQVFELHAPTGDCLELVSADALANADAVPRTPFNLTGVINQDNGGTWTWEDASYFSTGYRWELLAEGSGVVREGTTTAPRLEEVGLNPNTAFTLRVWTVNNAVESPSFAEHRAFSYPTRPTITMANPEAGAVSLTWIATNATEYTVEVEYPSGERRTFTTTTRTNARVSGLDGGTSYTFRVYAISQIGASSPPSDPVMTTTLPVTEIHVSTGGSDLASGAAGDPVATLGVALVRATAANAQAIRFGAGTFVEAGAVDISREMTLIGASAATTTLRIQGVQPAANCNPGPFNGRARTSVAALTADNGPPLHLRDIGIIADVQALTNNLCVQAVSFGGTQMSVVRSDVRVAGTSNGIDCAVGLNLRGAGDITVDDSTIVGLDNGLDVGAGPLSSVGLCAESLETLNVRDSELSAVGRNFPTGSLDEIFGVMGDDIRNLEFARNYVFAHAGNLGADAGSATVGGLWLGVKGLAFIHNSVFLTPNGGLTNRGIDVEATLDADVLVYHVTAHSGDRWGDTVAAAADHQGSALRIAGVTDRVELGNNLLNHAAGYGTNGWGAALNVAEVTAPMCDYDIRGNALSAADRPAENGGSALVIRDFGPEFGFVTRGVNQSGSYSHPGCSAADVTTASNLEFYTPPTMGVPDNGSITVVVDANGKPMSYTLGANTYNQTPVAVQTAGLPLNQFPARQGAIGRSVDGVQRPTATAVPIGAYD